MEIKGSRAVVFNLDSVELRVSSYSLLCSLIILKFLLFWVSRFQQTLNGNVSNAPLLEKGWKTLVHPINQIVICCMPWIFAWRAKLCEIENRFFRIFFEGEEKIGSFWYCHFPKVYAVTLNFRGSSVWCNSSSL